MRRYLSVMLVKLSLIGSAACGYHVPRDIKYKAVRENYAPVPFPLNFFDLLRCESGYFHHAIFFNVCRVDKSKRETHIEKKHIAKDVNVRLN